MGPYLAKRGLIRVAVLRLNPTQGLFFSRACVSKGEALSHPTPTTPTYRSTPLVRSLPTVHAAPFDRESFISVCETRIDTLGAVSQFHNLHARLSVKLTKNDCSQPFDQLGPRWEQRQTAKMHLSSHLSCASRPVTTDKAPLSVLNGASAESLPVQCTSRIALTRWPANANINIQALRSSASLITRKNVAGVGAVHSFFHTGLSLGRSIQLSNGSRWSATWLDNTATVEADVPLSVAWDLWSDREGIPQWMPWIDNVKILEDQPDLSRWTLKYAYFGQNWEFSWLSRNMKPTYHQKIHWRSVDGLPNRGTVRFYPRGTNSCAVQLTISYEVPGVLSGLGGAVAPIVENILQQDLNRFAKLAKGQQLDSQRK